MAKFNWMLPEVTLDGVKYSIVYLPLGKIRLCITGTGRIPGANEVRPWISNQQRIDDIWIGEGITEIGNQAFCGCSKLQRIWFPNTLQAIGPKAFEGCPLEEVTFERPPDRSSCIDIALDALPEWALHY